MTPQLIAAYSTAIVAIIGAVGSLFYTVRTHGVATAQIASLVHPMLRTMTAVAASGSRTMYDGINANAEMIRQVWKPGNLVCFYSAGNSFIWTPAEKAMFPPDCLVGITLTADYTDDGSDVLDVEAGGATPAQVHAWIRAKKAKGYLRPTIYCSLSVVPAIRAETAEYVLGIDYDLFVADWDGTTQIPYPAAAAKQYRNVGPYDISVVFDPEWPHRSAPPPPPPPTTKTVLSPTVQLTVPGECDHVVVIPYAIVHGKAQRLSAWRISVPM